MSNGDAVDLVTVVAQHKDEQKVLDAALKAGAPGATYFYGRGTGVRQRLGFLGSLIEAEKVVIVMAVSSDKTDAVVEAVTQAAGLNLPGNGFLCVQKLDHAVGMVD